MSDHGGSELGMLIHVGSELGMLIHVGSELGMSDHGGSEELCRYLIHLFMILILLLYSTFCTGQMIKQIAQ